MDEARAARKGLAGRRLVGCDLHAGSLDLAKM